MAMPSRRYGIGALLVAGALFCVGCTMKYSILQGTGLSASPESRLGVLVGRFPVRSVATRNLLRWEKTKESCPGPLGKAREAPKLKRPLPFDRLDKEIRDALAEDFVPVLDLSANPPGLHKAKRVPNPFRLTDRSQALLELEGRISVNSRDLRTLDCSLPAYVSTVKDSDPLFSEDISSFDIYLVLIDVRTSKMIAEVSVNSQVQIPFDSPQLKNIIVASLMAILTEQTPF